MTISTAATQPVTPLQFRNVPIRIAMLDGLPWFYLSDLCTALRRTPEVAKVVDDLCFPQFARRSFLDPSEGDITVLSPIGAWYLTELVDRMGGQALAAWTRREQKRLCPDPAPNDCNVYLTMLPDHCLPPRPARYSGRLNEWQELRFSPAGMKEIGRWPAHYAPVLDAYRAAEVARLSRGGLNDRLSGIPANAEGSR